MKEEKSPCVQIQTQGNEMCKRRDLELLRFSYGAHTHGELKIFQRTLSKLTIKVMAAQIWSFLQQTDRMVHIFICSADVPRPNTGYSKYPVLLDFQFREL